MVRSGDTTLVDGVDLRLALGSRTALVGASGAGKSLTCAALAGTLPASLEVTGSLTVEPDDADPDNDPRASSDRRGDVGGVNLLGLPAARRPRDSRPIVPDIRPTGRLILSAHVPHVLPLYLDLLKLVRIVDHSYPHRCAGSS